MTGKSEPEELAPRVRHAVHTFVAHLRDERGLSPNTVAAYQRDVTQFFRFAARAGVDDADQVEPMLLRRFLALLRTRGLAAAFACMKYAWWVPPMSGRFIAAGSSALTRTAPKKSIVGSTPRPRPRSRAMGLRIRVVEPGVRPPSAVTMSRDEDAAKTLSGSSPKSRACCIGPAPGEPTNDTVRI